MTMQIAFKGTDGLLLASDRKYLTIEPSLDFSGLSQTFGARNFTKIVSCKEHPILASFSGNGVRDDIQVVVDLCEYLDKLDAKELMADYSKILETWANDLYIRHMGEKTTKWDIPIATLLAVNPINPAWPIAKISITKQSKAVGADRILTNGDVNNPATFWLHYTNCYKYESQLTVKQFARVAAITIFSASAINGYGVDGLEIKTWTKDKWEDYTPEDIACLHREYQSLTQPILRFINS